MPDFDLRGKDWFTEAEAAHYCGVSVSQFREHSRQFIARRFLGKKIYARADLYEAISRAEPWHRPGDPQAKDGARVLPENLRSARLRPYRPRKQRAPPSTT